MSDDEPLSISIKLSPTQVDEVVRAASNSRAPSLSTLIAESLGAPLRSNGHAGQSSGVGSEPGNGHGLGNGGVPRPAGYLPSTTDPRLSRSLLRGLSILTCFGPAGESRGIVELADDLSMSPSTAHRYAQTLVELGLLERCPRTRKYRLPGTMS